MRGLNYIALCTQVCIPNLLVRYLDFHELSNCITIARIVTKATNRHAEL